VSNKHRMTAIPFNPIALSLHSRTFRTLIVDDAVLAKTLRISKASASGRPAMTSEMSNDVRFGVFERRAADRWVAVSWL
jgi:hypothetical protein